MVVHMCVLETLGRVLLWLVAHPQLSLASQVRGEMWALLDKSLLNVGKNMRFEAVWQYAIVGGPTCG